MTSKNILVKPFILLMMAVLLVFATGSVSVLAEGEPMNDLPDIELIQPIDSELEPEAIQPINAELDIEPIQPINAELEAEGAPENIALPEATHNYSLEENSMFVIWMIVGAAFFAVLGWNLYMWNKRKKARDY